MKNQQKDRYLISYKEKASGKWQEVGAKTRKEADELYDMVGSEAEFKVLVDTLTEEQLRQT